MIHLSIFLLIVFVGIVYHVTAIMETDVKHARDVMQKMTEVFQMC